MSVVVEKDVDVYREQTGGLVPKIYKAKIYKLSHKSFDSILFKSLNSVNVFGGLRNSNLIKKSIKMLCKNNIKILIISESPNLHGFLGILRRAYYFYLFIKYRNCISVIFGMGKMGVDFFTMLGFKPEIVFPFIYLTISPNYIKYNINSDSYNIIFIGNCIKRKGVDLLLKAIYNIKDINIKLKIVGSGYQIKKLKKICKELYIENKVEFCGMLKNEEAMRELDISHLLVLPSRFDGWGAVCNEALSRGVPVLCSDACGCKSLLNNNNPWRGYCFKSNDIKDLEKYIRKSFDIYKKSNFNILKNNIFNWSNCINKVEVAEYFINVINYTNKNDSYKPIPPWEGKAINNENNNVSFY